MSSILIYSGQKDITESLFTYSYSLDKGIVLDTEILNDSDELNKVALELRDEYCDYIYGLNNFFLKYKMIFDKKISLYFFSDVSNKRTELFDTYSSICHILILKNIISKKKINKVKLVNCSEEFEISFKSLIKDIELKIEKTLGTIKKLNNSYFSQVSFFGKYVLNLIYYKSFYKNRNYNKIKNLFLTRYPMHFNSNFKEEKYGNLVKKDDVFLISILTDGFHQGLSFKSNLKAFNELIKKKHNNILLLDVEVGFFDVIKNCFLSFKFLQHLNYFKKEKYYFKEIDISSFIIKELESSIIRLPRIILYKNAIIKLFKKNKVDDFYYHLHEYSYGRFFTYMLEEYFTEVHKIGFQHGPASMRKLLYFLSSNEVSDNDSFFYKLPLPDKVLAEDSYSKKVYEKANYKNVSLMKKIYRIDYLELIKRDNVKENTILIACGLHDAKYIFENLLDEIISNKDIIYYFKPHPRSNITSISERINSLNLENLIIISDHVKNYLNFVNEVVVSYSSVGIEAKLLGIKVRVISLPNKINESPLID